MIAAKLGNELESRVKNLAESLGMTVTQLVRIGLLRVIEECETAGGISIFKNNFQSKQEP